MTKQVETATVIGTIDPSGAGNATVIITARALSTSPETISVAVANNDTASQVAEKIRTALVYDSTIAAVFLVSGTGADVVLTAHVAAANDSTLNISIANGTCTGLTAAPTSTATLAGTGLSNGYCTLDEYKAYVIARGQSSSITTDAGDDAIVEDIIESVSRYIDNETGRRFYKTTETRYYTSELSDTLYVDDISTATGCTIYTDDDGDRTYENTWASTDYDLLPLNAETGGYPFTMVETTPNGDYTFPGTKKGVKITASFGWASVPDDIKYVCMMISQNLYSKRSGQQAGGTVEVTAAGIVIRPEDVPPYARSVIDRYRVLL